MKERRENRNDNFRGGGEASPEGRAGGDEGAADVSAWHHDAGHGGPAEARVGVGSLSEEFHHALSVRFQGVQRRGWVTGTNGAGMHLIPAISEVSSSGDLNDFKNFRANLHQGNTLVDGSKI